MGAWLVSSTSGGPGRGGRCVQNHKRRLSGGSSGARRLRAGAGSQAEGSLSVGPTVVGSRAGPSPAAEGRLVFPGQLPQRGQRGPAGQRGQRGQGGGRGARPP